MSEKEKQDKAKEVTAKQVKADKKQPAIHKLAWLALVILFALLAGLFGFVQQQQAQTISLIHSLDKSEQFKHDIAQVTQRLNTNTAKAKTEVDALTLVITDFQNKLDSVVKNHQLTNDDVLRTWRLANVEFLLQTANQRVLLAGDIENARVALTLADQQLKELADPRLYRLRALITDEHLALASLAKVDIEGLSLQLQSAIDSVDTLTVLLATEVSVDDNVDATAKPLAENWQSVASQAWNEVKSLVVIRHQQDGAAAVLVPEQRYFLYQNLRLKLESAQHALLSAEAAVFQANLISAGQWLEQYFVGTERDALLAQLTTLQAEVISVEIPDISGSLVWMQEKGDQ